MYIACKIAVKVSFLYPCHFRNTKLDVILLQNFMMLKNSFSFFSLTEEDLESLCVNETDYIVVSSKPFNVNGTEINPLCLSNYSERYFKFNLTDCYPNVQVMNLNV